MKTLKLFLFFILIFPLFLFSEVILARPTGWSIFLGAGQNFTFPAAVRVGVHDWEYGMLAPGFLGANKVFSFQTSSIYSSFGLGFNFDGDPMGIGFQAGTGFEKPLFWGLWIRGEIFALANTNGKFLSHGLLGVTYDF